MIASCEMNGREQKHYCYKIKILFTGNIPEAILSEISIAIEDHSINVQNFSVLNKYKLVFFRFKTSKIGSGNALKVEIHTTLIIYVNFCVSMNIISVSLSPPGLLWEKFYPLVNQSTDFRVMIEKNMAPFQSYLLYTSVSKARKCCPQTLMSVARASSKIAVFMASLLCFE